MSDAAGPAATASTKWSFDCFSVVFGAATGLMELSADRRLAHARSGAPDWTADRRGVIAIAEFLLIALGYLAKTIAAPGAAVPRGGFRTLTAYEDDRQSPMKAMALIASNPAFRRIEAAEPIKARNARGKDGIPGRKSDERHKVGQLRSHAGFPLYFRRGSDARGW